ncbi:MAG: glycosyltransferase family 39 protein [Chloroflexota bacterium]|nr:glycosyltransferase family 39 protein [Chloroflexota bacterium]
MSRQTAGAGRMAATWIWLILIILIYLGIAGLYAWQIPAWQAPDEPAHYNYIKELATSGQFPVLRDGDYDEAYLEALKSQRFPLELSIDPVRYESHQLPLYYLLQAVTFRLASGALLPLRFMSILLGALFVLLIFGIARLIFPDRPAIQLGGAAFVAYLPMHVAMAASINNDALAEVVLAAVLFASIRYVKIGLVDPASLNWLDALLLGLLLGFALITKVSAYVAVPVALAAPLIVWVEQGRPTTGRPGRTAGSAATAPATACPAFFSRQGPITFAAVAAVAALLMALPWYARNAREYGQMDFLARRTHDAVVKGQLRTATLLAESGLGPALERFAVWSHDSFWGVFGWMGVWMDSRIYTLLLAFTLAVLTGCLALLVGRRVNDGSQSRNRATLQSNDTAQIRFQKWALGLLALSALLTVAIYAAYNMIFVQPQGRYLFPALPAIALAVALGWCAILRPVSARWMAIVYIVAALAAVMWGLLGAGINKWSLAIFAASSLFFFAWSALIPRWSEPTQLRMMRFAYALPFAGLALLDLVALYAFVLPQLT